MLGLDQIRFARSRGLPVGSVIVRLQKMASFTLDPELGLAAGVGASVYPQGCPPRQDDLQALEGLLVHLDATGVPLDCWAVWFEALQAARVAKLISLFDGDVIVWQPS